MSSPIGVSVVCACKNERKDILPLIDSFAGQSEFGELLIIDDSTDHTRDIIKNAIIESGVSSIKLIEGAGTGCCDARNVGILMSRYEIICFMTADSVLPDNYFQLVHRVFYDSQCDALMVDSKVANTENIFGDFVQSWHEDKKIIRGEKYSPMQTQGYCVRKSSALAVGMIDTAPTTFNVCRDWSLVKKLDEQGYRKIYDSSIEVAHFAPSSFGGFYRNQFIRGVISYGYSSFFLRRHPFIIIARSLGKLGRELFLVCCGYPLIKAYRLARFSNKGIQRLLPFAGLIVVKRFALVLGELSKAGSR